MLRFPPRAGRAAVVLSSCLVLAGRALAQGPPGYYDGVDASDPALLRKTLHETIDDHLRYPYTSSSTDTWDILEEADQDPGDAGRILDVYRNESHAKQGGGNSFYNREHSWPNSYGFPNDHSQNYPYTDCHVLFLCDVGYNSSRSNKPFRYCSPSCAEKPTVANDGQGGGGGTYPGNSNWTAGQFTQGTWETWIGRRGDVARALLYMDVRYEGGTHGGTGAWEPDLVLTDDEALIAASNTGQNEPLAYMGMLAVLLQWQVEDPVDDRERARNDVVYSYQGNRNPFIDHPEWVACLFAGACDAPGLSYCFGDGGGTACPCSNPGAAGRGCANGTFPAGCALAASGQASVGNDTLVLAADGSTPSQPGLFFQGDERIAGGGGVAFGDGLRCAGMNVVRLEVASADSSGTAASSVPIAAGGGVAPGDTKRYQWWYRDPVLTPCGSGFNLSNGVEIAFGP